MIKKQRTGKRSYRIQIIFLLLIAGIIALGSWETVSNYFHKRELAVVRAENGMLEESAVFQALVVRSEVPVAAPFRGSMLPLVEEGQRIKAGGVLAQFQALDGSSTLDLKSTAAGIVSFEVDGLETVYNPKNMDDMDWHKLKSLTATAAAVRSLNVPQEVEAGELVMKVVDNLSPFLLVVELPPGFPRPELGRKLEINCGSKVISGSWSRVGDKTAVISVETDFESYQYLSGRIADIKVSYNKFQGTVIPARALVTAGDGEGVYLWDRGNITFQKVSVRGTADGKAAVDGLKEGSDVITNVLKAGEFMK